MTRRVLIRTQPASPAVRRIAATLATALLMLGALGAEACAFQLTDAAGDRARAAAALRTGQYDDALTRYERLAQADDDPAQRTADRRTFLRALMVVGRYDDAITRGERWLQEPGGEALANVVAEAHWHRGQLAEAERRFQQAASGTADSLLARRSLAMLQLERGDIAPALRAFDQFIDIYNAGSERLTAEELLAVADAVRQLGREEPRLFRDALRAYDAAIAADSSLQEAQVRLAELFLEKYNSPDAARTVNALLQVNPNHPDALLVAARRRHFDNEPGASELVQQALAVNPNLVGARVFAALQALDVEDWAAARTAAERALEVDAGSVDALAVLAAAYHLRGDAAAFESTRARAEARNARYAPFYVTLAEVSARNRLYADAVTFGRRAAALDSASPRVLALLGINELRVGQMAEGRRTLERAFERDPYDVWTKNTLDLLDATREYREIETPHFQLVMHARESELIGLYAAELAEEAFERLSARYGYRPAGRIRLEIYPRHADFSVRTVGLAGLGALGVSFGDVLAMDSPAARDAGSFNWGSTLWHEIAHTFTLGASRNRVPRWLSEGISVLEERRARAGWGADVSPMFLAAYKGGQLHPVSRLNDGFMRPAYPAQVMFSYYQASLVSELIEQTFGADALARMLRAYGDGMETPDVFRRVLGTSIEEFDGRFDRWLRERFRAQLEAVEMSEERQAEAGARQGGRTAPRAFGVGGPFADAMRQGTAALRDGRDDEALRHLQRARELFPGVAGSDSPHWHLAQLHARRGDRRAAAEELKALTAADENHYAANVELAGLLEQLGDTAGAAEALERAIWASPYEAALHERLATHASRLGNRQLAVRERRAALALGPVDRAEAHYQLAAALHEAGNSGEARREVLRALEIAPAFERAQMLLLTLRSAGASP